MKKFWEDFKKFIKRGNVVDMAVGVAVAGAFTAIVNAFTKGFITPLLALITGKSDIASMKWVVKEAVLDAEGAVVTAEIAIMWGTFVQAIIDFLIIAFTLFLVMRIVSGVTARTKKITEGVRNMLSNEDEALAEKEAAEKAEAEAKAKEAEEKAKAEAEALALKAAQEEAEIKEEKERRKKEAALLEEIRDLLKNKQ